MICCIVLGHLRLPDSGPKLSAEHLSAGAFVPLLYRKPAKQVGLTTTN